jgi:hypothetical protein
MNNTEKKLAYPWGKKGAKRSKKKKLFTPLYPFLPLFYPSVFYYPFEPLVAPFLPLKTGASRGKKGLKRGKNKEKK